MQRRDFFKMLFGLPLLVAGRKAQAQPRSTLLLEVSVAGFQYYEGERLWPRLNPGDPLTLVREPDNPYDERAVALYWKDDKLGYIPRADNAVIANLMDQGLPVQARLRTKTRGTNPWERLGVEVVMKG